VRIHRDDGQRLELRGYDGGAQAVYVPVLAGLIWTAGAGFVGWSKLSAGSQLLGAALLALALVGVSLIGLGLLNLLRRERLVIDRTTSTVTHDRLWATGVVRSRKEFAFTDVGEIALSLDVERSWAPNPNGPGSSQIVTEVWKAHLRLVTPRTAITLAEDDDEPPVREVAQACARVLGVDLVDEAGDERTDSEQLGKPLTERTDLGALELPTQPDGLDARVDIDPAHGRVVIVWPRLRSGCLTVVLAIIGIGWLVFAVPVWLAALGVLPSQQHFGAAWLIGSAIVSALGLVWIWGALVTGLGVEQRVEIGPDLLVVRRQFFLSRVLRIVPALNTRLRIEQATLLGEIESVRSNTRANTHRVDIGARRRSIRIETDREDSERTKWLAQSIRAAVKAVG